MSMLTWTARTAVGEAAQWLSEADGGLGPQGGWSRGAAPRISTNFRASRHLEISLSRSKEGKLNELGWKCHLLACFKNV